MKRYQLARRENKYKVANRYNQNANRGMSFPNLFRDSGGLDSYNATKNNRVHCVAVQRTAIYRDAHGNTAILTENQQTMNTPIHKGSISYRTGNNTWRKR